ncbi:hypothetical protein AB832_00160 [Flavobacteriaceae bacterium (ex Bugula neritina AB1)]|nr:hypothetical protein AB832_00160 [Flavobacteriaceae bacterium (ex Bugula neritina AB1)]
MKVIPINILILLILLSGFTACQNNENSNPYTIAYSSKESGNGEIYLTDIEGESKIKITNHPRNDGYVAW